MDTSHKDAVNELREVSSMALGTIKSLTSDAESIRQSLDERMNVGATMIRQRFVNSVTPLMMPCFEGPKQGITRELFQDLENSGYSTRTEKEDFLGCFPVENRRRPKFSAHDEAALVFHLRRRVYRLEAALDNAEQRLSEVKRAATKAKLDAEIAVSDATLEFDIKEARFEARILSLGRQTNFIREAEDRLRENSRIVMQKHDAANERVASLEEEVIHLRGAKAKMERMNVHRIVGKLSVGPVPMGPPQANFGASTIPRTIGLPPKVAGR